MRLFAGYILLTLLVSVTPHLAQAQFDLSGLNGGPEMTIDLTPAYPEPGQEVEASVNDYSSSLYGSRITWTLNGTPLPAGENRRSITFTAGDIASTQNLQVQFTRQNGTTQTVNTVVRPVYLDIILEPQTRTPDFYLGRSLPSIGSVINATALVSTGGTPRTTELVYTWQVNQQVLENGPLRGGYKVSFPMPMGDSAVLSVKAAEPNGTVVARKNILVPSFAPQTRFYEVSSLFGMNQIALERSITLSGNTTVVAAEPYHLDIRTYNNPDVLEWEINNNITGNTGGNPYQVTLQRIGTRGSSRLEFHVRDTSQVLQGTRGDITVRY